MRALELTESRKKRLAGFRTHNLWIMRHTRAPTGLWLRAVRGQAAWVWFPIWWMENRTKEPAMLILIGSLLGGWIHTEDLQFQGQFAIPSELEWLKILVAWSSKITSFSSIQDLQGYTKLYKAYKALQSSTKLYKALQSSSKLYKALQISTKLYNHCSSPTSQTGPRPCSTWRSSKRPWPTAERPSSSSRRTSSPTFIW